ncbi:Aste57867_6527 [Aphanomyces stellatus]|uniref:Aste57867_6527 protein n=1 Tax=Aphanomyces stellatus TaxID=120398 RepID=A0A485KGK0_9STRA|nr:hypothetical protein As57867_006510 [Aphanomyces stellatus]VFT83509.1 Aste57867_6527 [Aphanomyces stellatus]
MQEATAPRTVQVTVLASLDASLVDLEAQAPNMTAAVGQFLTRAGVPLSSPVSIVDASVVNTTELSLQAKGQLEITFDVPLAANTPRAAATQAWTSSIAWSGHNTTLATLPLRYNLLKISKVPSLNSSKKALLIFFTRSN